MPRGRRRIPDAARVVEVFVRSVGKNDHHASGLAEAQKWEVSAAFVAAEHARDPGYAKKNGV